MTPYTTLSLTATQLEVTAISIEGQIQLPVTLSSKCQLISQQKGTAQPRIRQTLRQSHASRLISLLLLLQIGLLFIFLYHPITSHAQENNNVQSRVEEYSARKESIRSFFEALSSALNKPIIVSTKAASKQISGDFDFKKPQALLEKLSAQLGLIWYHDGQSVYIYDSSETKSAVISLRNISIAKFNNFLQKSGLYDRRYSLRGEAGTFYVSGPPIFVDLVMNTAKLMDKPENSTEDDLGDQQKIAIVRLNNTFVGDRNYSLRDQKVTTPGIATILKQMLGSKQIPEMEGQPKITDTATKPQDMPSFPNTFQANAFSGKANPSTLAQKLPNLEEVILGKNQATPQQEEVKIVAYPDTNSLLIRGTDKQIRLVKSLISELDVSKRHVELSLWIIDLQKSDLDQLGVQWQGGVTVGNKFGISFNSGSISTLDGSRFLAAVNALSQNNKAQIISRPILLTQENIPAIFDNNVTFFAKLMGQYAVQLEHVTYGTLINVLPRFINDDQIEMSLDIEDGAQLTDANGNPTTVDSLPQVSRTHINTIARVPKSKSLLIGGYINDQKTNGFQKIPVLSSIPIIGNLFKYQSNNNSNMVRVFLIQPREVQEPLQPDASDFTRSMFKNLDRDPLQNRVEDYIDQQNVPNSSEK
jgi:type II secretory pathway component GspD/PulD (secretin)